MPYSDSSDFAWGGYVVQIADHVAKESFTELKSLHFILAQSGNSITATACPLKSS